MAAAQNAPAAPPQAPHPSTWPRTRTVFWRDNKLVLIDQRLLPGTYRLYECETAQATADAIRTMVVRGAPAIGAAGAFGMALAARRAANIRAAGHTVAMSALRSAKALLDAARPTAVNLSWATTRMLGSVTGRNLVPGEYGAPGHEVAANIIAAKVLAEAQRLADEDVEINSRMARHGARVVPQGANILHHCNTGALATVDVGTALGVVYECHRQGKGVHVWVDETRPRMQGSRLTAWELMRDGVPLHVIADNASGHLMRAGRVDVVLYGADRVAANGDVANKIGTYNVSVVARENGVPVYAVVPTSTIDLSLATGEAIPIEERGAQEVVNTPAPGGALNPTAPAGCPAYNPAFDVTPHRYVTGIVTEEGVCYPPFGVSLRAAKERAEARLRGGAGAAAGAGGGGAQEATGGPMVT